MPLSAGDKLGPYEILAPLGVGGMGEVYRGRDTKLEREVAVKILPAAVARDPERLARFQREAKVLAALNHPNIAQIYGVVESADTHALIMELVPGDTLKGPLPLDTVLNYARQIAGALEAAHEKGIVHRDLKPANIMVTPAGIVKVLDFGLAAQTRDDTSADPESSPTLTIGATQAGVILGTAAYMSPEQASGQVVDRRADIWSFGVVLLETLTGQRTFTGDTVSHVLAAVLTKEPDVSRAPAKVQRLLKSCLQKDPRLRLQAIGDYRLLLEEPTAVEAPRRGSLLPWAVAAMAIVAALAVSFLHFREAPPPAPQAVRFTVLLPQNGSYGIVGGLAVSPDGGKLVFAAIGSDGITRLWLRNLDSLETHPLPDTEGIDSATANSMTLAFSPDSRSLAFRLGQQLKKIDLAGGPSQTICDCGATRGASWNRDNVILLGSAAGILRVSAAGGTPAAVTAVNSSTGEIAHAYPSFLPDQIHFVYARQFRESSNDAVYEGDLNASPTGQSSERLAAMEFGPVYAPSPDDPGSRGRLLFTRQGTLMAQTWDVKRSMLSGEAVPVAEQVSDYSNVRFGRFSVSANGILVYRNSDSPELQPTWFDRDGKSLGTVGEPGRYYNLVLSQDGTKAGVGLTSAGGKTDLWVLDLMQGTRTRLTSRGTDGVSNPEFSPDGSRVVFRTADGEARGLWQKASNGIGTEELLVKQEEGTLNPTDWSRDGRFLLYFFSSPKTSDDLWVLPMDGDRKPFPFLRTQFGEVGPRLSPDGHWIGYRSNESGKNEIYVQRFIPQPDAGATAAAGKWIVSRGGGTGMIHWRKDGKELYYLSTDSKVMAVDVTTTGTDFHAAAPKALFTLPASFVRRSSTPGNLADIAPDGKRFLFALPVEQKQPDDFKVVLNWQAGLKN